MSTDDASTSVNSKPQPHTPTVAWWMDRAKSSVGFVLVRHWSAMGLTLVIFVLLLQILKPATGYALANTPTWWNLFDPIVTITTTLITLFIWTSNARLEWIQALPARLTVYIAFQDKATNDAEPYVRLICVDAPLTTPEDIRAWSQQIAKQMYGNANLDFSPFDFSFKETNLRMDTSGRPFRRFAVRIVAQGFKIENVFKPGTIPSHLARPAVQWTSDDTQPHGIRREEIEASPLPKYW